MFADDEDRGDLTVRVAGGYQAEDLCFARRQSGREARARAQEPIDHLEIGGGPEVFEVRTGRLPFDTGGLLVSRGSERRAEQRSNLSRVVREPEIAQGDGGASQMLEGRPQRARFCRGRRRRRRSWSRWGSPERSSRDRRAPPAPTRGHPRRPRPPPGRSAAAPFAATGRYPPTTRAVSRPARPRPCPARDVAARGRAAHRVPPPARGRTPPRLRPGRRCAAGSHR